MIWVEGQTNPSTFFNLTEKHKKEHMIYLNGEELDTSNRKADYKFSHIVADYLVYTEQLKERFGHSVTYLTKQRPERDEKTGNMRSVALKSWPKLQSGIRISVKEKGKLIEKGPYTMVWNDSQVEILNNIPILGEKNFLVKEGLLTVDLRTDPDKAYFLQFHNVCRSGEFYIDDPAKNAREEVAGYKEEQKVRDFMFSSYSPIAKNDAILFKVARRWGLPNVEDRTPDEVKLELFDIVMSQEEAKKRNPNVRGVSEFLQDTQLGAGVKAGELVSLAEDKGVLTYSVPRGEYQIMMPGRTVTEPYFQIPPDKLHRKRDYLIETLTMDDSLMVKLERSLGIEEDDKSVQFDVSNVNNYKYAELQTFAASFGIKSMGVKKVDLIAALVETAQASVE